MILLSLIIVLSLEFHFKIGSDFRGARDFSWFKSFQNKLFELFSAHSFFEGWLGIALILLLPPLVLMGFVNLFDGVIYWLVYLLVSVCVLFLSFGPESLESSLKPYFDAVENDEVESAFYHSQSVSRIKTPKTKEGEETPVDLNVPEFDELVRNTTRHILIESQIRYFGVIVWFIFFGPFGALFYRLSHIYLNHCQESEFDEHTPLMESAIHWINWIPARITSLLFLLTGDFVNGFYRIKEYLTDALADNWQLIAETGIAAQSLDRGISERNVDENTKTVELVCRTAIIYLVFAALVATLS
jgi:AmpE protein